MASKDSPNKVAVPLKLPPRQLELIDRLDETYGSNRSEKIRAIIGEWLGDRLENVYR